MAFSARDRANCERCHPAGADKTPKVSPAPGA
jgi:hypothetical protein